MGFLDRELAVLSVLGRIIGRGLLGVGRGAVGGTLRRRLLLSGLAVGGVVVVWYELEVTRLLTDVLAVVFGVPAPGQPLAPTTWMTPQNGVWPDVMALSRASVGVAVLLLLALLGRATTASDALVRRQGLKRVGNAALLVATTWTLLPFGLHLVDQVATALAPTPDRLLTSWLSTGEGVAVLAFVTVVQPLLVGVAVLAMGLLWAIIIVGFILWPLAWPLRTLEHDLAYGLGRSITALLVVAVVTKLLQAMVAFGMIHLLGGLDSLLMRGLVFVGGTIGVFVVLPVKMLQYADRVMLLPGALAPSQRHVGKYIEESSKRVGQAHRRVNAGLDRAREWRAPSESRAAVQTRLSDWNEETRDSSSWWRNWIEYQWTPSRHVSAEWSTASSHSSTSDGTHGPTSEAPDAPDGGGRSRSTDGDQSRSTANGTYGPTSEAPDAPVSGGRSRPTDGDQSRSPADDTYGPTSEAPDGSGGGSRDGPTDRYQSRWDEW